MNPDTENSTPLTAQQIAVAAGRSKKAVLRALEGIVPSGQTIVRGNTALTWAVGVLPETIRIPLTAGAAKPCQTIEQLLSEEDSGWTCPTPLADIKTRFVQRAIKLREAMAQPLARQHELSGPALLELGLAEYKRVFGYPIGPKQWNRLFNRIVTRAGIGADFMRLEIYMPSAAFTKAKVKRSVLRLHYLHRDLDEIIANLENKESPTADDRAWLFDAVFGHYEKLAGAAQGPGEGRGIKASLIDYLFSGCPGLSTSAKSLQRTFERGLIRWRESGRISSALDDARRLKSGYRRKPEFGKDEGIIAAYANKFGTNVSLARRYCRNNGLLSQRYLDYYHFDDREHKSYVPNTTRQNITPTVNMVRHLHKSEWEDKMHGPYIPRDPDRLPGDGFTADDMTSNNRIFLEQKPDSKLGFAWVETADGSRDVIRPDGIFFFDFACDYPIHFSLTTGRISGALIKSTLRGSIEKVGLPRIELWFENGPWRSRWVLGDKKFGEPLHWRHFINGLGLLNPPLRVRFHKPRNPRAKPAECIFSRLQERMRIERGFIGFNERLERMERVQDFISRVRSGKEDPRNELYSLDQWKECCERIMGEFANDPQNGKRLHGRTPAEAWQESVLAKPLEKIPEEALYTLANYATQRKVQDHGIKLRIRKGDPFLYTNSQLAEYIHREVICWYDIEYPDLLTVSDLNRQNFFTVKRIHLPATTATREQFREANSQINGHRKTVRTVYADLKHRVVSTITHDAFYPEETRALGRFQREQKENDVAEKSAETRKINRIREQAAATGASVNHQIRNPDRVLRGIELEKAIREKIARKRGLAQNAAASPEGNSL